MLAHKIKLVKQKYYLIILIMIIFFLISFITNVIGPLIPDIIQNFNLSLTAAGILPFSFFIAYGLFSVPSGYLIEFYGEKKIIIIGLLLSLIHI